MSIFTALLNEHTKDITSLAIGCFDGMHKAHFKLFSKLGSRPGILVIEKDRKKLLTPVREDFTDIHISYLNLKDIKNLSPKDFLTGLKTCFPSLKQIIVGYDFTFGKDAKASGEDISLLSDFKVIIVPEVRLKGVSVHKGVIKASLGSGELELATSLLGRFYSIKARVIKGQGIGKKQLLPTLNLAQEDYFLPAAGVYVTKTSFDGKSKKSVSFIGKRSTDESFSVETHLLDFTPKQSPQSVELEFISFLRNPVFFSDLSELKKQILKDKEKARTYFKALKKEDHER